MEQAELTNIGPEESQKHLCIVQLARIGDLIQTYIAAKSIKDSPEGKEFKTTLVARKSYAEPLRELLETCFDEVITLDYECVVLNKQSLSDVKSSLKEFIAKINKSPIHAVVNLTYSKTSAYLTSLITSPFKLGVNYSRSHGLVIRDHWSQYVYSNVLTGPMNPFSLVDIFAKTIGNKPPKINRTKKQDIKNIVIHPFTSQEKKHWKPAKWSEIIFNIFKTTEISSIKIVGSKKDVESIDEIINSPLLTKYKEYIHNLAGKTSISDVIKTLEKSELFMGHDSMVSHLTSLTGTQSVTISLGSVRPVETAPYGEGNYVVSPLTNCYPCFVETKCDHFKCHSDVPYQAINTFLTNLINGKEEGELLNGVSPFHTSNVQFSRTTIKDSGFLGMEDLIDHNNDIKQVFQKIYRITWLYVLAEKEENTKFPVINQSTATQLLNHQEGIKHLYQLSEFGKKYSSYILQEIASKTPSIAKIKEFSNKVVDVDKLQLSIKEAYPLLSPVIDYYAVIKSNLEGDNVVNITENAYLSYENCSAFCSILNELIDKTISDYSITHKPVPETRG